MLKSNEAVPNLWVSLADDTFLSVPVEPKNSTFSSRLQNCEILKDLSSFPHPLSGSEYADVCGLINSFPSLFKDVPGHTSVLYHDVDVGDAHPVKQHPYTVK